MEDVGIFYGYLVHFTVFYYILWTFGRVRGNLVYFSRFGILYQEKSGNPVEYLCTCACVKYKKIEIVGLVVPYPASLAEPPKISLIKIKLFIPFVLLQFDILTIASKLPEATPDFVLR
jgi:hypothetical protein